RGRPDLEEGDLGRWSQRMDRERGGAEGDTIDKTTFLLNGRKVIGSSTLRSSARGTSRHTQLVSADTSRQAATGAVTGATSRSSAGRRHLSAGGSGAEWRAASPRRSRR